MTPALPEAPVVSTGRRERLRRLARATARRPPAELAAVIRDELAVDLTARYGGIEIPHPFGKASGQLSCTVPQVEADVAQGIAYVVLKTVIAEDAAGARSMGEWTVRETRMRLERRVSGTGGEGWTVTWNGRGWPGTLATYLEFFERALGVARERDVPVVPSVKYHLPAVGEPFRVQEYEHTTGALLDVWSRAGCGGPIVLEKDFSPTLAGDDRARAREGILRWISDVPRLVGAMGAVEGRTDRAAGREGPAGRGRGRGRAGRVRLGLKLMNALFDDHFQVEMLRAAANAAPPPAFLVVFNRLFDPGRGTAYGGYDLSDRNLRVLERAASLGDARPPLVATGNIGSGRIMLEYARRGCESGQVHTFFQVPLSEYTATGGGRTARALHTLLLHPDRGLVAWLWHLHEAGGLESRDGMVHFLDAVAR